VRRQRALQQSVRREYRQEKANRRAQDQIRVRARKLEVAGAGLNRHRKNWREGMVLVAEQRRMVLLEEEEWQRVREEAAVAQSKQR
jgi:hypothetical protein